MDTTDQATEVSQDSPTSSPPPAKRAKRFERDANGYCDLDRNNAQTAIFQSYYKAIVPEAEWDVFMDILFQELPSTFRVCGSREDVMELMNERVEKLAAELLAAKPAIPTEGASPSEPTHPTLKKLEWYPGGKGWQVEGGQKSLKNQESPLALRLRTFIIDQTTVGHLSRQEAVSMIPPLFMDIKEHHKILDMCAAPGSKTSQLIEMLHRDAPESYNPSTSTTHHQPGYNSIVRGMVHANDTSAKRINTLITQTKRLSSPSLMVTHHDAQYLPTIRIIHPTPTDGKPQRVTTPHQLTPGSSFLYDRILCDVPCSGDGTLRKNADLWMRWVPTAGHSLHPTQIQILSRAIALSAPGARIVYSTCSMNPVEDEAVIVAAIGAAEHKVRLVDVSSELPLLKRRPGMYTWRCMDNEGKWYSSFEEVPEELRKKLVASSFPPTEANAKELQLERCMRFLPHDQDTGGFFVAVLERCDSEGDNSEEKVQKRTKYKKPQPAEFEKLEVTVSNEVVSNILRFFEIDENKFPTTQLVKHEKGMHKLYLVTRQSALLIENDPPHKIKLKSVGVRVFESMTNAQGSTCNYRITQDGVESLYPFLGPRRVIQINDTDFNVLFEAQDPLFDSFSTNTAQRLQEMEIGSVVFSYFAPMGPGRSAHHILLVGWRGKVSTQILIKPSEKPAILATFNARVKEE